MTEPVVDPLVAAKTWLEETPLLTQLQSTKEQEAMQSLLGHEGFRLFLGLLLGTRQGLYAVLAAVPLGNSADAARLSVIQGKIQGIDLVHQTVLESFTPVGKTDA